MARSDAMKKRIDDAIETLGSQLDRGTSYEMRAYLKAMARFHRYSWGNILLIAWQKPDASRVAGYQAWRKLGRQVKRGEKGIAIMAPIVRRQKQDEEEKDEHVFGFKTAYVFDVSQTEGEALPEPGRVQGDPGEVLERLKAFVTAQGIHLGQLPAISDAEGVSQGRTILIRPGLVPAAEFSVLVHELAHEMLHWDDQEEKPSKTVRETEAEVVVFVVCEAVGLETNTASSDYISLYQGDKETLAASLDRIQRAAARIIEGVTAEEELALVREAA